MRKTIHDKHVLPAYGGTFEQNTTNRLKRIETRMLKGFERMGIDITSPEANIQIDEQNEIIRIPSASVTIGAILSSLDGRSGEWYVMLDDTVKGVLRT